MKLLKIVLKELKSFFSDGKKKPFDIEVTYEHKRKIIDLYRNQLELKILVETGTFLGDTIEFFKVKFNFLFSIELSEELATRAKIRFKSDKNIKILNGDSGAVLEKLVPELNEPTLFWLDGHYSSEFYLNGEYFVTAKADKNTPIEKELDIILNSPFKHTILIDDARLFIGENDYPTIQEVEEKVKASDKGYKVIVTTDIIQIIPN
jgi:hypothetical protein